MDFDFEIKGGTLVPKGGAFPRALARSKKEHPAESAALMPRSRLSRPGAEVTGIEPLRNLPMDVIAAIATIAAIDDCGDRGD